MRNLSFGTIIYLIIGLIVASNHGYLTGLSTIGEILSAIIAIALWPLIFFGANLHLSV